MIDVSKITVFTTLEIGRVGENEFRPQQIDISAWLTAWPGATVSAVFSRPDGQLYTVLADVTTSPLTWTPGTSDLAAAGDGKLELRIITADGVVGKSAIINTVTHGSLGAVGDTPTPPAPDWTETVAENATEARTAATDAQQAAQVASDAQQAINTAEPDRVLAEQERAAAESERASAESGRATAESNRSTAESDRQTAESNRVTAEQNRVTAETNRANAESARGTAETNRVNAETIRGDNEDTRQSNESTRQQNEAARVTAEQNRQGQIDANTASISTLTGSELQSTCVVYPRLPNGTINTFENGSFIERVKKYTLQASDVITRATAADNTVYVTTKTRLLQGCSALTWSYDLNILIAGKQQTVADMAYYIAANIDCYASRPDGALTFLFAAETTLAQAQTALAGTVIYYQLATPNTIALPATKTPNTQELVRLSELVDKKADNAQGAWITPTLINSWVEETALPVRYMKDSMGFVHIKGAVKNGVSAACFVLPAGYRPAASPAFVGMAGTTVRIQVSNGGTVSLCSYSGTCYLDCISFKAEA